MALALDHLVFAARTLAEGAAWCEATLGLRPGPGGRHSLMGTHNRLFALAAGRFPRAYVEIIAIDPDAPPPGRVRWFDLDDAALQRALAPGPRLVHWVARCDAIQATCDALRAGGVDCGEPQPAERATPQGLLRWQISLRADGRRPLGGAAPALIEWGERHPTDSMAASGLALESMCVGGWPEPLVALLPATIQHDAAPAAPPLRVVLAGPRGRVSLQSIRLEP